MKQTKKNIKSSTFYIGFDLVCLADALSSSSPILQAQISNGLFLLIASRSIWRHPGGMHILAEHMLRISRFISCKTLVYLITF